MSKSDRPYIGPKQNILQLENQILLYRVEKGTFEFKFTAVTLYSFPQNLHLSNRIYHCGGQVRTKNYSISHSRVYHTITVKYKKVGQTFCFSLPPICLKRN